MIADGVFLALVAGSFFAAAFNAAFSIGGALLILAVTTTVLPVSAVVPLHSGLLIGSTLSRCWLFRPYMQRNIVLPFLLGSLFGAAIGTKVYVELPDNVIAIAIGSMMLVAIWLPEISWRPKLRHPWVAVGFLHSLLSAMFAYGALLHAVVLHTGLERRQIIATMAGCLRGHVGVQDRGLCVLRFRLHAVRDRHRGVHHREFSRHRGGQAPQREAARGEFPADLPAARLP